MFSQNTCSSLIAGLVLLLAGTSVALADQVTLTYVDASMNEQTLILDCNTSNEDLALAASLMGEEGVGVVHDPDGGCGTLAELATALATAAPVFAPSIAQTLAGLSPEDTEAIVAAINAIPGVNTTAVLAAVHFGPFGDTTGPRNVGSDGAMDLDLTEIEQKPSRN